MKTSDGNPDFARWAVTGVVAPIVVIVILRFAIAPFIWGADIADKLGATLGGIFILWLLFLAIAATLWKIRSEKKQKRQND